MQHFLHRALHVHTLVRVDVRVFMHVLSTGVLVYSCMCVSLYVEMLLGTYHLGHAHARWQHLRSRGRTSICQNRPDLHSV